MTGDLRSADGSCVWNARRGDCVCLGPCATTWCLGDKQEECGPSLTVELWDLPNFERRSGLDLIAALKERQLQKWTFERETKAVEVAPTRNGALPTVRENSVVVLDNENGVK